jgi:hypothetical protein
VYLFSSLQARNADIEMLYDYGYFRIGEKVVERGGAILKNPAVRNGGALGFSSKFLGISFAAAG